MPPKAKQQKKGDGGGDVLIAADGDGSNLFDKTWLRPSLRSDQYVDWVGRGGWESEDEDEKKSSKKVVRPIPVVSRCLIVSQAHSLAWGKLPEESRLKAVRSIMRLFALAAHTGGMVSGGDIKAILKKRDIPATLLDATLHAADVGLRSMFGYEVCMEAVATLNNDNTSTLTQGSTHHYMARLVPLTGTMRDTQRGCAPPYRALQSMQVDVGEGNERLAARRGLLMGILCILVCSEDQVMGEEELLKILHLDGRLAGVVGVKGGEGSGSGSGSGSGAKRGRGGGGGGDIDEEALAAFEEMGAGGEVLIKWMDVIKRLVSANYLTRTKAAKVGGDGAGGGGGAKADEYIYGIGSASRAYVGVLGAVEVVRAVKGDVPEIIGVHTREKTRLAMPLETGLFAAQNHLPADEFSLRDLAGDGEEGEEEGEGEEEE